jgi:hypothetical protein
MGYNSRKLYIQNVFAPRMEAVELYYGLEILTLLENICLGRKRGVYSYFLYLVGYYYNIRGQLLELSLVRKRAETI